MSSPFDLTLSTAQLAGAQGSFSLRHPAPFPILARRRESRHSIPNGLVVSSEDSIRFSLGETLLLCGIAPVFASNLAQAAPLVAAYDFRFVLCQDSFSDGKYADLLLLQRASQHNSVVIVVSPTGDWPEYFEAMDLGAHDFLAYPLIPGELPRIIRASLAQKGAHLRSDSMS